MRRSVTPGVRGCGPSSESEKHLHSFLCFDAFRRYLRCFQRADTPVRPRTTLCNHNNAGGLTLNRTGELLSWGLGFCLMHPPLDVSLTFKKRSESWCAGLCQESSFRENISESRLYQLAEIQIQQLPQSRPLRCVAESEDTGSIGLEELITNLSSIT